MEIWRAIFNSYSENELFVSPFNSAANRAEIEKFVDALNPTPKQKEEFQDLFNEFLCEAEMRTFYAGFKIGRRLDLE